MIFCSLQSSCIPAVHNLQEACTSQAPAFVFRAGLGYLHQGREMLSRWAVAWLAWMHKNIPCPFGHILLTRPQLKGPQNSFFTIFPWEQELGQHLYSCTLETSWVCVRLFWLVHIHKSSQSLVLPLGEKERTIRTGRHYIILAMIWLFQNKNKTVLYINAEAHNIRTCWHNS